MDELRSEEEQLQALKRWWSENGWSTVLSVIAAVALVFGWQSWGARQQATMDAGAVAYQQLLQAVMAVEAEPDDIKIAEVEHFAETIKEDFSSGGYSHFAALIKAKQAVVDADYESAVIELNWVLDNKPSDEVKALTQLRLARVLSAQNEKDQALALLSATDGGAFAPYFAEARGDLLLSQERYREAYEFYEVAQTEADRLAVPAPALLKLKTGYVKSYL